MEIGGNSNNQDKDTTRASASASASGTINPEAVATNLPAINVGDQNLAPPQDYRRKADLYMPMTNIVRILRRALPSHAKISDDAKDIIQECVSEFIFFVTNEANEKAHREYKTPIYPEDVIDAMASLGFNDYVEPLTVFLNKYRAEDPERAASIQVQLPMAMRSAAQQPSAASVAPPVPPLSQAPIKWTPMSIYIRFPEVIRKYFLND
ncbi:hypothetical protein ABFS83_05G091800 [Erythranthe nasuta]